MVDSGAFTKLAMNAETICFSGRCQGECGRGSCLQRDAWMMNRPIVSRQFTCIQRLYPSVLQSNQNQTIVCTNHIDLKRTWWDDPIVDANSCSEHLYSGQYVPQQEAGLEARGLCAPHWGRKKRLHQIELQFKGTGWKGDTGLLVLVLIFFHLPKLSTLTVVQSYFHIKAFYKL